MKSLYLVDISSFIFRAYYAIRPLSTKEGTPVNAVFGVVNMINRLIEEKKPDHLIVCKDRPDKGFRHEIFPEYKANRGAPPEDLVPQFALIQEFIDSYPIHSFDKKSYEADDIIATLVRKFETQKDLEIFIVSSDKDLMQLVSDKVFLYDTMKNKIMGIDAVNEKFGVTPDKVIDVQALCGDSTDNIPGIPGIGPKTATKLVNDYGSVEAVLDHADELKGKMKDKVKEGRDMALLSKKLVALATDVPLDLDWNDLSLPEKDQAALNEFYSKLDFQKFIVDVNAPKKTQSESKADFVLINSEDALKKLAQAIKKSKTLLCFDTETDHINSTKANLVGMSFCFEDNKAYYLPIAHKDGTNLKIDVIKEYLGPIFSDASIKKAAQNAKYDLNVLRRAGFEIAGLSEDTMIAAYLADPTGQHGLDFLSDKFLGHKPIAFKDLVGKGQTFADVPLDKATEYAAEDAWLVSRLIAPVLEGLQEGDLKTVYQDLELPLVDVLSRMELNGIQVDLKFLEGLDTEFSERIKKIEKKIYDLAGEEFNLNSPKQLSEILFEKLGLPVIKKTKTGFSTNVDVLTALQNKHELPAKLLEYRGLAKLQSTYVQQIKTLVNENSNRLHTTFNQAVVATGRLSSTDPNLQNIPIRSEDGRRIREAFVAPKGSLLLSADYSQIELRLLAAFSEDPKLRKAYKEDEDIHARTAAQIFGMDISEVDGEHRSIGKTINFGVIYGQSAFGLANQLGVPNGEAKNFIDRFYEEFARVKVYKDEILEQARKDGFVSTYLGRRRYLPDLNSKNKLAKQNAERVAFNTVFQGSAADLIKTAMVQIDAFLRKEKWQSKMLLQVHDELIFEVPDDEMKQAREVLPKMMSEAFSLAVPLKVSVGFGKTWGEAH